MKRFRKLFRSIILTFLVINQFYFSLFALEKYDENKISKANETYFEISFNYYDSNANLSNKISVYKSLFTTEKISSEKFYNIVLSLAEETGFLFFINSERNPNSLLSVITEQTIPRSPPFS